tara:strand:+ start:418 stop:564 length:147 start_codon:yes stop_codon:yes gene_type:complete
MKNIWNWIKNLFTPKKIKEDVSTSEESVSVEETAKQKKIRLKHKGDIK